MQDVKDEIEWETGPSPADAARVSGVERRHPLPSSAKLRVFRSTLPILDRMKIGDEKFVPVWDDAEEQVIASQVRKANARIEGRRWFRLQEWRLHVKGRLIVCVHPEVADEWEELWEIMRRAMQTNKKAPPLDPLGNALAPRLRVRPE